MVFFHTGDHHVLQEMGLVLHVQYGHQLPAHGAILFSLYNLNKLSQRIMQVLTQDSTIMTKVTDDC